MTRPVARWLLVGALLVTVLVYWVGLNGPFVMDDPNNLDPIKQWLHGENSWRYALLGNTAGLFGRALSMATLMANAWLAGDSPHAFKLGNLVFHLACGVVGWQVLRRALARDPNLATDADPAAALLTALWLLHPLNVSTVLYVIQRMAQVSTLPGSANSVVALKASTGAFVWGFQVVHHDLWDYDVASQPVLIEYGGKPAVAVTTKMGNVFVLDRLTGKPLHTVEVGRGD